MTTLIEEKCVCTIRGERDVLKARRQVFDFAGKIGFDRTNCFEVETIISELGMNLVRHTKHGGVITVKALWKVCSRGILIESSDNGPGFNVNKLKIKKEISWFNNDSLGIGLQAVRLLSDECIIKSEVGLGTKISCKKWLLKDPGNLYFDNSLKVSVYSRPYPGYLLSGDSYVVKRLENIVLLSVIDALGHGDQANEVAVIATKYLEENVRKKLKELVEGLHAELTDTRGAAASLCRIDYSLQSMEYVSIGNVQSTIYGSGKKMNLFCLNGTFGMAIPHHFEISSFQLPKGAILVMYSDGVKPPENFPPGLLSKSPQEIGIHIFQTFFRSTDDATVIVSRL
ncbi:MAG: SpoIIE family protein phosphatase [Candidatus Riflebacteria bacterium]|nr:SpoIIE family protein phosphatase [Candidatus Riflebacteria bacterium]